MVCLFLEILKEEEPPVNISFPSRSFIYNKIEADCVPFHFHVDLCVLLCSCRFKYCGNTMLKLLMLLIHLTYQYTLPVHPYLCWFFFFLFYLAMQFSFCDLLMYALFLSEAIMRALRSDGNVLLPVDTAGRALELILILEQVNLF